MQVYLTILQDIISLLTGGIVGIAKGIGGGIVALIENMFFAVVEGQVVGLNPFAIFVIIMAGITLAIGLSYKLFIMVKSLGKN